jgi:DNA-binding NarL/FixJ family response regulator
MTGLVQQPIPHPAGPAEFERLPAEPVEATEGCPEPRHCPTRFTASELRVLLRIAIGLTDEAVASACHLSPHTVRHHVASAMRRASARSRTELVAKCFAAGILSAVWPPAIDAGRCLCGVFRGQSA